MSGVCVCVVLYCVDSIPHPVLRQSCGPIWYILVVFTSEDFGIQHGASQLGLHGGFSVNPKLGTSQGFRLCSWEASYYQFHWHLECRDFSRWEKGLGSALLAIFIWSHKFKGPRGCFWEKNDWVWRLILMLKIKMFDWDSSMLGTVVLEKRKERASLQVPRFQ